MAQDVTEQVAGNVITDLGVRHAPPVASLTQAVHFGKAQVGDLGSRLLSGVQPKTAQEAGQPDEPCAGGRGEKPGMPRWSRRGERALDHRQGTFNLFPIQKSDQAVENVEKQDGITCSGKAVACLSPKSLKLPS